MIEERDWIKTLSEQELEFFNKGAQEEKIEDAVDFLNEHKRFDLELTEKHEISPPTFIEKRTLGF